nr:amidohydrolase family protein [Catenibacillus scindens]
MEQKHFSIKVCETTNAALYELTKKYPGKILGSAALPVKNMDAAVAELEKCVKEYHFVAWHTHSNYGDTAPYDLAYRSIFQKAAELGIYIYLHPRHVYHLYVYRCGLRYVCRLYLRRRSCDPMVPQEKRHCDGVYDHGT